MSIAIKLQTIAENEQKVYDKGYEEGFNSAPLDWAGATTVFRVPNLNLIGRKEVVLNIPLLTNLQNTFEQTTLNETVEHITVNGSLDGTITNVAYMFAIATSIANTSEDTTLKHITLNLDLSKSTNYGRTFYQLAALEVIDGNPLDFSSATTTSNVFNGCRALKKFRVVPLSIKVNIKINFSSELSPETRQSIIDGLADLTGQTTQTVTFHSTVGAKLTDEQKATITAKNWTLAY